MITFSIDVTRLDKTRFTTITRRDGTKAIICDLVAFDFKNGPNDSGQDGMVKQQVTREERQAMKEMPILGNFKNWDKPAPAPLQVTVEPKRGLLSQENDEIPF